MSHFSRFHLPLVSQHTVSKIVKKKSESLCQHLENQYSVPHKFASSQASILYCLGCTDGTQISEEKGGGNFRICKGRLQVVESLDLRIYVLVNRRYGLTHGSFTGNEIVVHITILFSSFTNFIKHFFLLFIPIHRLI